MKTNQIIQGDCLEVMKDMPDKSVDLVLTDPPYGYSFMGKDWDKVVMGVKYWKECLRVLKNGAFIFVMSAPRQDVLSRAINNLSEAGFNTGFTSIYWTYASGFPKAGNIGKMVDKRKGTTPDQSKEFAKYIKKIRLGLDISLSKADERVCGGTTNYSWFEGRLAGQRLPKEKEYEEIKNLLQPSSKISKCCKSKISYGLGKIGKPIRCSKCGYICKEAELMDDRFDKFIGEAKRDIVGRRRQRANSEKSVVKLNASIGKVENITIPKTDKAKELDGSYAGFQPKPAVEVIIVAMKPLSEKTYVDQALKNKKGITWLDDCRVPYESDGDRSMRHLGKPRRDDNKIYGKSNTEINESSPQGRFPANLLVSDDVLNDGKITKSTQDKKSYKGLQGTSTFADKQIDRVQRGDSGSFSRYFDLDKWFFKTFPFLIVPKASKSEKNKGLEGMKEKEMPHSNYDKCANCGKYIGIMTSGYCKCKNPKRVHNKLKNFHPTVKPIKLMSYLIVLGSRIDDIVLDPFVGSGTTCIAAKRLKRKYIGIEKDKEYCKIAEARLKAQPVPIL